MQTKTFNRILTCICTLALLTACSILPQSLPKPATPDASFLPNPASAYCEQQGYTLEIRTAADGSQSGVCIFTDGSECDEWAYYRGECQPITEQNTPQNAVSPNSTGPAPVEETSLPTSDAIADDGCKIYRDLRLGYSFHYPAEAEIVQNDNPLHGIMVVGPVIDNESWPVFGISHPPDREEYRPPEDADLLQWLTDHYLLGETQLSDMSIAGTTAIHFRHARSPQSYASDRYFFARAGQLYVIDILHAGDQEDWDLYNHFLESIQFE